MKRFATLGLFALTFALTLPSPAAAQATRTWVSGVGDDANPCSRTAPCKTFAGAISKTAVRGEISVLDPGGFGAVTITKAITLSGDGTLASILASVGSGIIVNAGAADTVIVRGLSLEGAGTGTIGIRYIAGGALVVENTTIHGFTQSGIDIDPTTSGNVSVKNVTITGGTSGVRVDGLTGMQVRASLTGVAIQGTTNAIDTQFGSTSVNDSVLTQNAGVALFAEAGTLSAENVMVTGNGTAAMAMTGATIRLSNNSVYDNLTGFGCGGGVLASAGNNRKAGNVGGTAVACTPGSVITLQ
jgi:hypothetical protein